ncbi:unnamed protein product [Rotaria sp. Silwood1]|nr:unnamed protein product [Rotaria sp. Silwood1]CAF1627106.1 unnamed protein product [Rotaria sp. Silwood1]CAF3811225.1 unnamed protein product [Rotaria sp. Silwood1]CAF4813546.1 unnamed protein product [Rotaria sp. Silwood1]CAF4928291.1 unnamed protein product [Rotaria sp. Silwood1]
MPGVIVAGNSIGGDNATQLSGPGGIFVDVFGILYVADSQNHRIQRWDNGALSGVTVAGTGVGGSNSSQLYYPRDIVVDSNDYMYIANAGDSRIIRWAPNSNTGECIVACSGIFGNGADQISLPFALAFDSYGSIYISDTFSSRVQKFEILDSFGYDIIVNNIDEVNEDERSDST